MQRWASLDDFYADAVGRLDRVAPADLASAIDDGAVVVDVRDTAHRLAEGELEGAHVIDLTVLEWRVAPSSPDRILDIPEDRRVILVCNEGYSSVLAAIRLQSLGLPLATDLDGGYRAWVAWRNNTTN